MYYSWIQPFQKFQQNPSRYTDAHMCPLHAPTLPPPPKEKILYETLWGDWNSGLHAL